MVDEDLRGQMISFQKDEITEHHFYEHLARREKCPDNKEVLESISRDELAHYNFWRNKTGEDVSPSWPTLLKYRFLSRVFGITFSIKLLEGNEERAQREYEFMTRYFPEAGRLVEEEDAHERKLINMIDERRLRYSGAVVRGLNDGIVELTGEVAGLTFVFQDTSLIAFVAIISGMVGSLSLASSEYLAAEWEEGPQTPLGSAAYTLIGFFITLFFLIWPYLLIGDPYLALMIVIVNAIVLILFFNYHLSVAKEIHFKRRFGKMLMISLGIAAISFVIGFLVKTYFHLEV